MSKEYDLIQPGIPQPGGTWADIGSGTGIFTLVLCELLGADSEIYSVDRNGRSLEKQRQAFEARYPDARIHYVQADFTKQLDLPQLDGMLMANSLHFVPFGDQEEVLRRICAHLKPGSGKLVIVEYEAQRGNPWVPYPIDYASFEYLAGAVGVDDVHRLAVVPSSFMKEMYSASGVRAWR